MIVIIDYGLGNLGSIANMLKKIGTTAMVSSDPEIIRQAEKLILPGVGAFDSGMNNLNERGLIPVLNDLVLIKKVPILGLCLGMQLLTSRSEEGQAAGLGWLEAESVRFNFGTDQNQLKVPHMGWNTIEIIHPTPLVADLELASRFYFVHSYHVKCKFEKNVLATTEYGYPFASIIGSGNILGVQFHPEKSHKFGKKLLANFAGLCT